MLQKIIIFSASFEQGKSIAYHRLTIFTAMLFTCPGEVERLSWSGKGMAFWS